MAEKETRTHGYALIQPDEDGQVVRFVTEAELREDLDEQQHYRPDARSNFLAEVPDQTDPQYWGERDVLVIRYEVIVPKPVETVTEWELPDG